MDRVTDWVGWHQGYDKPEYALGRRLEVVQRRIGEVLDVLGPGPRRIVRLCAGDGRDLIPVLAGHPRRQEMSTVLVELNEELSETARQRARQAGLDTVDVRCGDASDPGLFGDVVPTDLLVLCGMFGNISDDDVARIVGALPLLVSTGGYVIWTRGASEPDRRPRIRRWIIRAGLVECSFDGEPEPYGVGVAALNDASTLALPVPDPLFTFVR
jgi:hypothetical protein